MYVEISQHSCQLMAVVEYRSPWATFKPQLEKYKNKKIHSEKISYILPKKSFLVFWEMELSSPKLKRLLIFQEGIFQARKIKLKITL